MVYKLPNCFGAMPFSFETITLTFTAFTQPSLHATWCNRITQEPLQFEQLAGFSFVAERQIATECSHCGLGGQRSPVVKGGRIRIFLAQGQWDVRCRESLWFRAGSEWGFVPIYGMYLCSSQHTKMVTATEVFMEDKRIVLESYLQSTGCWGLRSSHPGDGNVCKMLLIRVQF